MDVAVIIDSLATDQRKIAEKLISQERLHPDEGLSLFRDFEVGVLGMLADYIRNQINGDYVYFNRNIHLEPTNICIHNCRFCSYSRKVNQEGAWELTPEEIKKELERHSEKNLTEIHVVGGVHPNRSVDYYADLLELIKQQMPEVHIKAFTAAEIEHMARKAGISVKEALRKLKKSGLDSLPGGGAEIFDEEIRSQICPDKTGSSDWLDVHRQAHNLGIQTNCTILYGHIESYQHRINHLDRLRDLQDETGGFNAFIPLKYKSKNNELGEIGEVTSVEDLKNYAVSRLYLDNIPHIKAYWPMTGKDMAAISLSFGVDDLDGTIEDTTRIYSMAGASDQNPEMNVDEILSLIRRSGRIPVERDSLYNPIKIFHS